MAGAADLLGSVWPWALAAGAILVLPGALLLWVANVQLRRLASRAQDRHADAWNYLHAKPRRMFDWSPKALRTGDSVLDASLLRQRRLEHVGGALLLPGMLLLALANLAWTFS